MILTKIYQVLLLLFFTSYMLNAQHSLKKMPYPVNTDVYDEICPILAYDEAELFFTRVGSPDFDKSIYEGGDNLFEILPKERYNAKINHIFSMIEGRRIEDPSTSSFNQDVWFSHFYKGEIYNIFHPSHPLNNALPNSICSHYGKDNSYVVINEFDVEGGVHAGFSTVQKIDDDTFTFPEPLIIKDFDKEGSEVNLSMSLDKEYIIMAMDNPHNPQNKDLFLSIKGFNNVYSPPIRLSNTINSPYREATPFFSQDKTKLYFSSNRPGGIGGMDIYVAERLDFSFENWSEPVLLGQPINSPEDDSHPYVAIDENSILFTSNRDGTSDIFFAKMIRDTSLVYEIEVNVYIVKNEERTLANALLYWGEAYKDGFDDFFRARDGKYKYVFKENVPMKFKAQNRGLKSDVIILDPQDLQNKGVKSIDVELHIFDRKNDSPIVTTPTINEAVEDSLIQTKVKIEPEETEKVEEIEDNDLMPLEFNSTVVLKNILFKKAKPDVLPVSYPSLMKLAKTLIRRTDAVIQVEGHTDNVGDSEALLELSLSRANAIKKFLVGQGVKPGQVRTKGFGASMPITKNRNEKERSQNRRVEIRVLRQNGKKMPRK